MIAPYRYVAYDNTLGTTGTGTGTLTIEISGGRPIFVHSVSSDGVTLSFDGGDDIPLKFYGCDLPFWVITGGGDRRRAYERAVLTIPAGDFVKLIFARPDVIDIRVSGNDYPPSGGPGPRPLN
jgi:hypothetical protein